MIPSIEQCLDLMERYEMLDNIKAHSLVVEKVAGHIAQALKETGLNLSCDRIAAGALMHDIGKTYCIIAGKGDHSELGRKICIENRLYEIVEIVSEHVRLSNFVAKGRILEKEIVYYADKRVNHDEVVSLPERLEYILGHYGRNDEDVRLRIIDNFNLSRQVEKKLFAALDFDPDELAVRLEKG